MEQDRWTSGLKTAVATWRVQPATRRRVNIQRQSLHTLRRKKTSTFREQSSDVDSLLRAIKTLRTSFASGADYVSHNITTTLYAYLENNIKLEGTPAMETSAKAVHTMHILVNNRHRML